jgi:hypothetical protein
MKKFILDHMLGLLLILGGIIGWAFSVGSLGENAAIVGPDRIVYKFVAMLGLGLGLVFGLLTVRYLFTTVWKYVDILDLAGERISDFEKDWANAKPEVRLCISVFVFASALFTCVFAFSS